WLRVWFSIGMGFSLTTLIGVTLIILLESARAFNLYDGIPWLNNILNGPIFGFYYPVSSYSISVGDIGYMCISSIISVSVHELGHALAAT
nr:membrane-bound transcription factor site-2 protease homolog isoform X2 [Tanacetum cinerariifolium]